MNNNTSGVCLTKKSDHFFNIKTRVTVQCNYCVCI